MNFRKILLILMLSAVAYCFSQENIYQEALDPARTYENWLELISASEDTLSSQEKIRTEAQFLQENSNDPWSLYYSYRGFLLLETPPDSLQAETVKNKLLQAFPQSEQTYDLAYEEFYDRIYPVWRNDSLKVVIISDLLEKYPETGWRRTMYQYLLYSLEQIGDRKALVQRLREFQVAFPRDYLPWLLTARYLESDQEQVTDYAYQALEMSYDYPYVEFYPEMEWQLEARSASVKAVAILAERLIDKGEYEEAVAGLKEIIAQDPLTVEDETTLGRCYYLLAKAYAELEVTDLAEEHAVRSLISGDSRNFYTPQADTLLKELLDLHRGNSTNLDHARERMDYEDVSFTDVTEEAGLSGISAGRIAWGDYDADGWQDFLLNGSRLFRNLSSNSFQEVTATAFPDTIRGNGGLWGDLDNDGDLDIVTKDPESIWFNTAGVFHKSDEFPDNGVSTEGLGLGDVNKDGWLDIYVANYEKNYVYETDQFFLGNGGGRFREAAAELGLLPQDGMNRAGRGVNFGDPDNDGDLDIFVSNYRLTKNFFWQNDGSGHFHDVAEDKGVSGVEVEGWWGHTIGSEWGDLDNDKDLDLVSCNLAHPRYLDFSDKTMILTNSGFPHYSFVDIRAESGISFEETHSEPALGDLNNDGYLDLYINDIYAGRRSFLYMNNGDLTFRDVTYLSGTRHFNGWGVAFADFDNDGDLDILAAGGEIQFFRNDTPQMGNWLQVEIIGKAHSDAIGTRLILENENISLLREIQGGKGTTNQHSLVQHFGLGQAIAPFDLTIRFPDGDIRLIKLEKINQKITIKE